MADKCKKICDMMSAYIDGMTCEKENRMFLEHIGSCEKCRDEFNDLKYIISLSHEILVPEPSPELKKDIMAEIRKLEFEKRSTKNRFGYRRLMTAAVTLAASAAVILIVYNLLPSDLLRGKSAHEDSAQMETEAETGLQEDENMLVLGTEAADRNGDKNEELAAMGAPYIFEVSISTKDLDAARSEIDRLIEENVVNDGEDPVRVIEDSEKRYHITVFVTAQEGEVLYEEITKTFDDHTITENETGDDGIISIIIEVP